jgi:hypothetical protein
MEKSVENGNRCLDFARHDEKTNNVGAGLAPALMRNNNVRGLPALMENNVRT